MKVVNWKLISHPINWVTIMLMLMIAAAIGHLTLTYFGIEPDTQAKKSSYDEMPAGQAPGQEAAGAIDPQGSLQVA